MKKGSEKATAIRIPPSGGLTNEFIVISAPHNLPLARSSRSLSTSEGINVWAALSLNTSANPNRSAET